CRKRPYSRRFFCYIPHCGDDIELVTSAQLGAALAKNSAEHVPAAAVAAVAPVRVVLGVLHDQCVARGQQNLAEIAVLTELGANGLSHDVVLDLFPVGADGLGPISTHPGGDHRRLHAADRLRLLRASKFLWLEEMLGSWPDPASDFDWICGEIGEAAVLVARAVEVDHPHHRPTNSTLVSPGASL